MKSFRLDQGVNGLGFCGKDRTSHVAVGSEVCLDISQNGKHENCKYRYEKWNNESCRRIKEACLYKNIDIVIDNGRY